MTARALLVDREALEAAQAAATCSAANGILMDAFYTDVRPALADWRESRGLPADPMAAYAAPDTARRSRPGPRRRQPGGMGRVSHDKAADRRSIKRSNRLGADPHVTNYAGGNTSAKGTETDPVTGEPVELLWVKGSGGDLGTLTEAGLAVLRLDRFRALVDVYPGVEREDEMVAAFDYALHGKGGAAPSIDTAMHGLVDAAHVDHLHPDCRHRDRDGEGRREAHQEDLRRRGRVGAVAPARVPARARHRRDQGSNPQAIGCILGGHGITAWGKTSDGVREEQPVDHPHRRGVPRGKRQEGSVRQAAQGLRRAAAASAARRPRRSPRRSAGIASHDAPMVGHFTDSRRRARLPGLRQRAKLAELGTSCPDHFLRTKIKPMILDLPANATVENAIARLKDLHEQYRKDYTKYYEKHADADSPAMRGADPLIVLIPGVGMFSYGATKQTARVAGEFYVNAINVMRGAESVSTYAPIDDAEKFRIEYWALEEAKLRACPSRSRTRPASRSSPAPPRASARRSPPGSPQTARASSSPTSTSRRRRPRPPRSASTDVAVGLAGERHRRGRDRAAVRGGRARLRRPRHRREQRRRLALQAAARDHRGGLGLPARHHGQGLVPRVEGHRARAHRAGHGRRRDLHRVEELGVRRPEQHRVLGDEGRPGAPGATARGRARRARHQGQRHQPRRRRARLRHLRRAAGAPTAPRPTASKRTTSASSTRSARSSSARCCPRTSRTRCRCSPGRTCRTRPASTSRWMRASRRPSCDERSRVGASRSTGSRRGVDLGATSGRVMLGRVGPDELSARAGRALPERSVTRPDGPALGLQRALRRRASRVSRPPSRRSRARVVGIDSWAVDYGLLDAEGGLLEEPFHYRDERTAAGVETVHALVPLESSTPQRPAVPAVQHALPVRRGGRLAGRRLVPAHPRPDRVRLTGPRGRRAHQRVDDRTARHRRPASGTTPHRALGLPRYLFPELVDPGTCSVVRPGAPDRRALEVVARRVARHRVRRGRCARDRSGDFAYISCGTWGLVGVELDHPVLTERAAPRTSPTRAASTGACGSCTT